MSNYKVVTSPILYPETLELKTTVKVLDTHINLKWLLDHFHAVIRNNLMKRRWEATIPGHFIFDEDAENSAIELAEYLATINLMPVKKIGRHIKTIAEQDSYHPIVDGIAKKPWDGVPRLEEFIDTLNSPMRALAQRIVKTWMCAAVAAIFTQGGFVSHGVLVLQGKQNIGKTGWIKSLDPFNCDAVLEGANLDPSNKDDVMRVLSYWIVELGELDSTFKKDIARLKAFITSSSDNLRNPYAYKSSHYHRRTVFAASVNTNTYLVDETGNRRWWTVPLDRPINFNHGLDIQQVWAEAYALWKGGHPTYLSREDQAEVDANNTKFEKIDSIKEKLLTHYDWSSTNTREMTTTQVMEELGYTKPSRADATHCGKLLTQLVDGRGREIKGLMRRPIPYFLPRGIE